MKKTHNQKGMALVSVLIIIALLSIMAGTIMQLSYLAYSRKVVERRNTETFYTAEASIDTIKSALQNKVAGAVSSVETSALEFSKAAFAALFGITDTSGLTAGAEANATQLAQLTAFLKNKITYDYNGNLKNDKEYYNGYKNSSDFTTVQWGIDPANGGEFTIGGVVIQEDSVRIKDVHIKYVNKQGYVAEITTDILINAPIFAMEQMSNIPLGTYSMFAGNGMTIKDDGSWYLQNGATKIQASGLTYLHQEGNTYVGTVRGTTTSLKLTSGSAGAVVASFGGTNCVFNGDILVENGNTLIFTGGDGTENANVQVNGYIYLKDGGTLLMAPNVSIICKGIYADSTLYTGDGNTNVNLAGVNLNLGEISQFYPISEDKAKSHNSTLYNYYNDFKTYGVDVCNVLQSNSGVTSSDLRVKEADATNPSKWDADPRAAAIAGNAGVKAGVYILDASRTLVDATNKKYSKWTNRAGNKYKLVTYSGGKFKWKSGNINNIYVPAVGTEEYQKLNIEPKVYYNGIYYDYQFSKIINIQVLDMFRNDNSNISKRFTNYKFDNSNSKSYTLEYYVPGTGSTDYLFGGKFGNVTLQSAVDSASSLSNPLKQFEWEDISDTSGEDDVQLGSRKLKVISTDLQNGFGDGNLSGSEVGGYTYSNYKIEVNDNAEGSSGSKRKYELKTFTVGEKDGGNMVVSAGGNGIVLGFSRNAIEVHATKGAYCGLFMAGQGVTVGQSSGFTRGISLIEMAEKTTSTPGLAKDGNPVREMLEEFAGGFMCSNLNQSDGRFWNSMYKASASFDLVDNMFNGGIEVFWNSDASKTLTISGKSDNDEDSGDLISVDKWKKD